MNEIAYTLHKMGQMVEQATLKIIIATILSVCFFLFGHLWIEAIIGVLMLMVFDTILGVGAAYHEGCKTLPDEYKNSLIVVKFIYLVHRGDISSRKFSRAVVKGVVYFMAISAGYFADLTVPLDVIQGTMIAFVGVTEFISILENIGKMGFQTPKKLLNSLKQYRNNT